MIYSEEEMKEIVDLNQKNICSFFRAELLEIHKKGYCQTLKTQTRNGIIKSGLIDSARHRRLRGPTLYYLTPTAKELLGLNTEEIAQIGLIEPAPEGLLGPALYALYQIEEESTSG